MIIKRSLLPLLAIMVLTLVIACNSDDDNGNAIDQNLIKHQQEILGKWLQIEPICANCDTLIFTEDGRLTRIVKTMNDTIELDEYYQIKSAMNIEVQRYWDSTFRSFSYKFNNEYDTLRIEEYIETGAPFGGNLDLVIKSLAP